jgi:hypothetical protein
MIMMIWIELHGNSGASQARVVLGSRPIHEVLGPGSFEPALLFLLFNVVSDNFNNFHLRILFDVLLKRILRPDFMTNNMKTIKFYFFLLTKKLKSLGVSL